VFDEHKDYEVDLRNHPDRVLQSGRVTLGHLKVVGAVALAVQVATCLLEDGGVGRVTFWWALTFGWTLHNPNRFVFAAGHRSEHWYGLHATDLSGA
jgi:4-hydroxybenzoate polyprenyltransferase